MPEEVLSSWFLVLSKSRVVGVIHQELGIKNQELKALPQCSELFVQPLQFVF